MLGPLGLRLSCHLLSCSLPCQHLRTAPETVPRRRSSSVRLAQSALGWMSHYHVWIPGWMLAWLKCPDAGTVVMLPENPLSLARRGSGARTFLLLGLSQARHGSGAQTPCHCDLAMRARRGSAALTPSEAPSCQWVLATRRGAAM